MKQDLSNIVAETGDFQSMYLIDKQIHVDVNLF